MNSRFQFFRKWLIAISLCFAAQGIVWIFLGSFDPFGLWDSLAFQTFFDGRAHEDVIVFRRFVMVPFGATIAGYFVLISGIVIYGFPTGQKWTYWTVVVGVGVWFLLDTVMSVVRGGVFNVWLVNIPCIILLAIPLVGIYPMFADRQAATREDTFE